jgi:hypothetical protein
LGPFQIFRKIRGDIHNFVFVAGVNDTGNELFTGVNDTGNEMGTGVIDTSNGLFTGVNDTGGILSAVSLLPGDKLLVLIQQ